jgi:hypothetical protein
VAQPPQACQGSVMRDIDIINKAMDDAKAVLHEYIESVPRDALVAAQARLWRNTDVSDLWNKKGRPIEGRP